MQNSIQPLISIVVPVYNVAQYLQQCLDSIANQTYRNLEVIMINDGSSDDSKSICQKMTYTDRRFTLLNQSNKGLSIARNIGTSICRGEWTTFVDSDDILSRDMITELFTAATQCNCELSMCLPTKFSKSPQFRQRKVNRVTVTSSHGALVELLSEKYASTAAWGKLAKTALWKQVPFPPGRTYEDLPTTWKVVALASRISLVSNRGYGYRRRSFSISTSATILGAINYKKSIQQLWQELPAPTPDLYKAKAFRCCLECSRLLELLYSLKRTNTSIEDRIIIMNIERYCKHLLDENVGISVGNSAAPLSQRMRLLITRFMPTLLFRFKKVRYSLNKEEGK